MEVHFGMAKVRKYAVSASGDTLEMVERPHGGLSFVLVDGQRSGKSAKAVSNLVARKAIQLLSEGIRDGAAARAAHDYLYTYRGGRVTATLNIVSVDRESKTFVVSRNNPSPVMVYKPETGLYLLDEPSRGVGTGRRVKPIITELPIAAGTIIVAFTDGLRHAGSIGGDGPFAYKDAFQAMLDEGVTNPQEIADRLLEGAVACDHGRPRDDISVFVVMAQENESGSLVRRLSGRVTL